MELASDSGSRHDFQVPQTQSKHALEINLNIQPTTYYMILLSSNKQWAAVNNTRKTWKFKRPVWPHWSKWGIIVGVHTWLTHYKELYITVISHQRVLHHFWCTVYRDIKRVIKHNTKAELRMTDLMSGEWLHHVDGWVIMTRTIVGATSLRGQSRHFQIIQDSYAEFNPCMIS